MFNQSLAGIVLPESQSLTLGDYFDQSLRGETLKFGRDISQNLEGVAVPENLR